MLTEYLNRSNFSTLFALAVGIAICMPARGEVETELRAEKGPYFVGLPVTVQLSVSGLPGDDVPDVDVENEIEGLRWSLQAANPTRTRYQFNNQVTEFTKYDLVFEFVAEKSGELEIGPFVITQGSTKERVESVKMKFEDVPNTDDMRIKLNIPEGPFFPGERVPIELEWWYSGDLSNTSVAISSPLFDTFRFEDEPRQERRQTLLPIQTADGGLDLVATHTTKTDDGKTFEVFKARRTMIPDRVGTYELDPISVTIRQRIVGRRRSRGGFFSTIEEYTKAINAYRAEGKPFTIVVGGFPDEGRPESFAGAVGKGFSIEVNADRTVVHVGDPIQLDIRLRGDGNLIGASLPRLSADGGLDATKFRLPNRESPGEMGTGEKKFKVNVRVEDESIQEIPSIAYSWYDTDAKEYRTAYSDPIALRVMPAKLISANDVVSSTTQALGAEAVATADSPHEATGAHQSTQSFTLTGANLAIERNPNLLLLSATRPLSTEVVQTGSYVAGIALIFIAFVDRRRREQDPEISRLRRNAQAQVLAIKDAFVKPRRHAAEEIATALRTLVADQPDVARNETQSLIGTLETLAYQPAGSPDDPIDTQLVRRAQEVAHLFVENAK